VVVADPVASGSSRTWRGPAATRPVSPSWEPTIASKWLELLKENCATRQPGRVLFNPATTPLSRYLPEPIQSPPLRPSNGGDRRTGSHASEIEAVFAARARELNGGLIVMQMAS